MMHRERHLTDPVRIREVLRPSRTFLCMYSAILEGVGVLLVVV